MLPKDQTRHLKFIWKSRSPELSWGKKVWVTIYNLNPFHLAISLDSFHRPFIKKLFSQLAWRIPRWGAIYDASRGPTVWWNSYAECTMVNESCMILHTYTHTYLPAYLPTYLHAYLPTCLPTYLPTCLPAYLPTYLPGYLPTCLPATYLPTCLPAYLPTCLPAYLPTCLPAYLPTCLPAYTSLPPYRHAYMCTYLYAAPFLYVL